MLSKAEYDAIAPEYYSPSHVTSRNFDDAIREGCKSVFTVLPCEGRVLDVGSGRGSVQAYLGIRKERVFHLDISSLMLALSPHEAATLRVRGDALRMPFKDSCFTLAAAFLYDPFNRPALYGEISRVLEPGGVFVGALPHAVWGSHLRDIRGYDAHRARFLLKSGRSVEVNSFLMNDIELRDALERNGLRVERMQDLRLPSGTPRVSPDIAAPASSLGLSANELPIVKLMVGRRS